MIKTLVINAHPEPCNEKTYCSQMLSHLAKQLKDVQNVEWLTLYETQIPRIDATMLSLFRKSGNDLTADETLLQQQMQTLLAQFKSAKRIIIIQPIHNFNIPSKLKDYMDNILIARETFRYTKSGSEGLMTDGRKVLLLQSSGSVYTNNDRYTPLEFSYQYLKEMFCNIMGFDAFEIIRMQGTAVSSVDNDQMLQSVLDSITNSFPAFLEE